MNKKAIIYDSEFIQDYMCYFVNLSNSNHNIFNNLVSKEIQEGKAELVFCQSTIKNVENPKMFEKAMLISSGEKPKEAYDQLRSKLADKTKNVDEIEEIKATASIYAVQGYDVTIACRTPKKYEGCSAEIVNPEPKSPSR